MIIQVHIERMRRAVRLAALGTFLAFVPSATWADFSSPVTVSPAGKNAYSPQVAIDADGEALIVWESDGKILARSRSATGVLGQLQTISSAGSPGPQVAMSTAGRALIVWVDTISIKARTRSKTGALSPVQTVFTGGNNAALGAGLAINGDGDALIAWYHWDGTNSQIQARFRSSAGVLGKVQMMSAAGANVGNFHVAIGAHREALVVWDIETGTSAIRARSSTGTLGPIQILNPSGGTKYPHVVIDSDGEALIVWQDFPENLTGRVRSKSGVLGPLQVIGQFSNSAPQVALDAQGGALVVWSGTIGGGGESHILARARHKNGALGPVRDVSRAVGHNYRVARGADGDSVVVWNQDERIRARTFSKANVLGRIQILSGAGSIGNSDAAQVVVQADGSALAVWARSAGSFSRIQAAEGP